MTPPLSVYHTIIRTRWLIGARPRYYDNSNRVPGSVLELRANYEVYYLAQGDGGRGRGRGAGGRAAAVVGPRAFNLSLPGGVAITLTDHIKLSLISRSSAFHE